MQHRNESPRAQHRLKQNERANEAASLGKTFPSLKSLTVVADYFDPQGLVRQGGVKFRANIENAKSVLYFHCVSGECTGGDFDLTQEISRAVVARRASLEGEMHCQGLRRKPKQDPAPCGNVLRYKLVLGYQ